MLTSGQRLSRSTGARRRPVTVAICLVLTIATTIPASAAPREDRAQPPTGEPSRAPSLRAGNAATDTGAPASSPTHPPSPTPSPSPTASPSPTTGPSPTASPSPTPTESAVIREELEQVDQRLATAQQTLDAARRQLDGLDVEAAEAAEELAVIEAQLALARARAQQQRDAASNAVGEVRHADGAIVDGRSAADDADAALADRVVWLWKHGPSAELSMRMEVIGGAGNAHDLAVGNRVVDQVVAASRGSADLARQRLADVLGARDIVGRDSARRGAFVAGEQLASVDVLRRQQIAVTTRISGLRDAQDGVVQSLAADRDVVAALAANLRRLLSRVSLAGALVPAVNLPLDGPAPPWTSLLPSSGQAIASTIEAVALRHGVDGALMTALVWSESAFHAAAVSHAGAIGLTQLMPGTAAGLRVDPWDPIANLEGGTRYLRAMLDRFGSVDLGLAAYNAGPGRVRDAGNTIPEIVETQLYVVRVIERWDRLRAAG